VPIRLYITPDPGLGIITVEVEALGRSDERDLARPLRDFLRRRPLWGGPDPLIMDVRYPAVLPDAFKPGTAVVDVEQLEREAGITWPFMSHGALGGAFEWWAETRRALTAHLRDLSQQPPDLFG